jgi:hypothetical protein
MPSRKLPEAFADLSPFVEEWALTSEQQRFVKLHGVTIDYLRTFYDAMLPRLEAVLHHLNQYRIGELPEEERTLFDLAMTFAETAHPIDLKWKDVDFPDAYSWQKFEFRTVSAGA